VYHKYRVRLDPDGLGVTMSAPALRDHVLKGLQAEGCEAVLWQRTPLPAHPLFADPASYPVARAVLDDSLVIGSQSYPLFAQPLDVVEAWADAFEKVWTSSRS
jgi:hypothetical protein